MVSFKSLLLLLPALAFPAGFAAPTPESKGELPAHAAEIVARAPNTIWIWAGPNYTGPSMSLTYYKVNDCGTIPWQTLGSIWIPDNIVCTFTVKPGDCWDTQGNFRSQTIFPSGLADIRQWYEPRKADFPAYWFNNARSIQCGGSNF
ncbi:hypothetical protein N657DRAFT_598735 [Parathielavia appendiculata]|uniref:MRSP1/expansin-like protein n=1 Tax=Parathielavia appendiculata TaxID=2587402 RepID=A0AAN6TY27_9PEZI|nr:hypothetical protein N657DRAFT_598735 [Parathielavia appendiculata]